LRSRLLIISSVAFAVLAIPSRVNSNTHAQLEACLPAGIRLADVAERRRELAPDGSTAGEHPVTVEEKLKQLGACCDSGGKLIDANHRAIVFFRESGCWGYPPPDHREILQKQRAELETLRKEHTVITMTCNPSGARIP
jgi:hypothetical protein